MSTSVRAIVFDPDNRHWLHFTSLERVYTAHTLEQVCSTLEEVEKSCLSDNLWAVGWISYEAAPAFDSSLRVRDEANFPKVWFATFTEPAITDELPATKENAPLSWTPSITKEEYLNVVQEVRSAIARGDTY